MEPSGDTVRPPRAMLAFTRQAFLRDDVPRLAQLTTALANAASAVESDAVYALLTANPVLGDGNALFSAAHKNLMPAAVLDAQTLAAASGVLAAQVADGHVLHLAARYLLVGVALGTTARQLATTATPPDPAGSGIKAFKRGRPAAKAE